jgi:hypothetical protein
MKPSPISVAMLVVSLLVAPALLAQSPDSANQNAASPAPSASASAAEVPRLIKFSGTLLDAPDRPMTGPVGVTFALHAQQTGGAALWIETQNVTPDAHGNYTVLLGANSANRVPAELFASGEAKAALAPPVGFGAFQNNTAGGNAAFGFQALQANTTGTNNDAFGGDALLVNTTGGNNSAFGGSALFSNTAGSGNSAFGFQTLASNITGNVNSAFGFNALNFNTASGNSAFGALALFRRPRGERSD